ncbi:AdoR, partial [Drosophila busckii]
MSEYRFISITDYQFTTNRSQNLINLPITPYYAAAQTQLLEEESKTALNIPYTVFEILVAIVSIIGNLMVIIVFQRERKLRRRTNYYIVSLAIADFLVGSLGVPFAILASVGLPTNLHACLFTVSLLVVLCTISIFCLVAVSVDRYWAILYPMAYSRNVRTRTAIVIISVCWVAGAIVGFLPLFGWHADVPHDQECLFVEVMDYNYLVFLYFATIITPALLMLAFYTHIYRVIIKQVRQIVTMNPASDLSRRSSTAQIHATTPGRAGHTGTMLRVLGAARKRDVKATQNLSIIVLFFMICWIPLYTINCVKAFCPDCYVHPKLTLFCIILSHLNSAVNPVLYAYHLKDFRLALKNLMLRLMGVDIDQQAEAIHRFSVASQHRLHSMDSNMRNSTHTRMYVGEYSPIWLRQQQEALKNSQLLPKCGVLTPCVNSINQTVAAAVGATTDIERDMWNIVEASSGAEMGEVSYEFPSAKLAESDHDSSLSVSVPATAQPPAQSQRCDSVYSYDNHNYSTGPEDGLSLPEDAEYEDVFVPQCSSNRNQGVDPVELRRSLACVMREKLRSDDTDYFSQQRVLHESNSEDIVAPLPHSNEQSKPCTTRTSPSNGLLPQQLRSKLLAGNSSSDHCLPQPNAVYVIDGASQPLRPGHKPKYRKSTALTRNSRKKSRSCSCTNEQRH